MNKRNLKSMLMNLFKLSLKHKQHTHIGNKYSLNQDAYSISDDERLFVLCDGMGGANAGEVASQMTCSWVIQEYEKSRKIDVAETIAETNKRVYELSRKHKQYEGMGTTIVSALFRRKYVNICSVGDSRVYHWRKENLVQITEDHTVPWTLHEMGTLSKEELRNHPKNHILTQAIGTDEEIPAPKTHCIRIKKHDRILLCTDGLHDMISEQEIAATLQEKDLNMAVEILVEKALNNGGRDNVTVIMVEIT